MSSSYIIGKRYARAIFELAQEQNLVEQIDTELGQIAQLVQSNDDLKSLLEHPVVGKEAKKQVFHKILQGQISELAQHALDFIIEKGREKNLSEIHQAYVKIANEAAGRTHATVYSAYPLSKADISAVHKRFGSLLQKDVEIKNVVDPALIGGLKVQIGDTLYDGSISSKLESMKKYLSEAKAM